MFSFAHVKDSGIPGILSWKSGILGFGIRYTAQGIRNPTDDCTTDKESAIQYLESGMHGVECRI